MKDIKDQIIEKYLKRIKIDYPEDDKLYMDLKDFAEFYHEAKMNEITDEDIEIDIRRRITSYGLYNSDGKELYVKAFIEGAKALRDGLIIHREK